MFCVARPNQNIFLHDSMLFVDDSSMNFLYFFLKTCKGATYPMGWLRCTGVVQIYLPVTEPKFRPGRVFLLGSTEAPGLIPVRGSGPGRNKHRMPGFVSY